MAFNITPYSYAQWQRIHFNSDQKNDPAISGYDADPNQNGISNLHEYARGTPPLKSPVQNKTQLRIDESGALDLDYKENTNASETRMVPWTSTDLIRWDPAESLFSLPVEHEQNPAMKTIRQINEALDAKRFFTLDPEWIASP
ncbi:MAG: hypothetical protein ACI8Z5_002897 [Lentimonas sp.]|jgi:hypothetical protein